MPATSVRSEPRPAPAETDTIGRTTAITVISAIRPWWALFLRFNFARVRRMRRLTGPSGIDRALKKLSFIHFAHWAVFDRIPPSAPRRRARKLPQPYLLFQSNFNGGAQEYIEAFSMTVRTGMRALWGGAYDVPPPTPVGPFIEYIRTERIPVGYYYCAYPEASTTMVCDALELRRKFEAFRAEAVELEPDLFADAYARFVTEAQRRSATGPDRRTSPAGRGLCVLTPFTRDAEEPLREAFARFATGEESPFAETARTHFARFVVVPHLKDRLGHQLDATSYLLFAAEFDGGRDEYVESLATAPELRSVWSHCSGYPVGHDTNALSQYLLEHRIEPGYSFISYPTATLADVRASLALEKRLDELFLAAQGVEPAQLKRLWLDAFPQHGG
jgi:hypothetical protein